MYLLLNWYPPYICYRTGAHCEFSVELVHTVNFLPNWCPVCIFCWTGVHCAFAVKLVPPCEFAVELVRIVHLPLNWYLLCICCWTGVHSAFYAKLVNTVCLLLKRFLFIFSDWWICNCHTENFSCSFRVTCSN